MRGKTNQTSLLLGMINRKAHSMKATAGRRGLPTPPVNVLKQAIWWTLTNPTCQCGKEMVLSSNFGTMSDTISLHHDPDGSMMFICQSCNSRIKNRSSAAFFQEGVKECNRCKEVKPTDQFYNNNSKTDKLSTYCKPCTKACRPKKKPKNSPFSYCNYPKKTLHLAVEVGSV